MNGTDPAPGTVTYRGFEFGMLPRFVSATRPFISCAAMAGSYFELVSESCDVMCCYMGDLSVGCFLLAPCFPTAFPPLGSERTLSPDITVSLHLNIKWFGMLCLRDHACL